MNKIKIYSDEDLSIAVSRALQLRGFEAYTTIEQGNSNNTDGKIVRSFLNMASTLSNEDMKNRLEYLSNW